ncbi:MAG: hypothetical protein ACP5NZ_02135 [Nanobdellota archaeon]
METNYNSNISSNANYNSFIWAYHKKINPPEIKDNTSEDKDIKRTPLRSELEDSFDTNEIQQIIGKKKKVPDNFIDN